MTLLWKQCNPLLKVMLVILAWSGAEGGKNSSTTTGSSPAHLPPPQLGNVPLEAPATRTADMTVIGWMFGPSEPEAHERGTEPQSSQSGWTCVLGPGTSWACPLMSMPVSISFSMWGTLSTHITHVCPPCLSSSWCSSRSNCYCSTSWHCIWKVTEVSTVFVRASPVCLV